MANPGLPSKWFVLSY